MLTSIVNVCGVPFFTFALTVPTGALVAELTKLATTVTSPSARKIFTPTFS